MAGGERHTSPLQDAEPRQGPDTPGTPDETQLRFHWGPGNCHDVPDRVSQGAPAQIRKSRIQLGHVKRWIPLARPTNEDFRASAGQVLSVNPSALSAN